MGFIILLQCFRSASLEDFYYMTFLALPGQFKFNTFRKDNALCSKNKRSVQEPACYHCSLQPELYSGGEKSIEQMCLEDGSEKQQGYCL